MLTMMTKEQHALCSLWLAKALQSSEARALSWCRVYPISIREEHFTERSLQSKTAGIEICTDCMNLQLGRSHARNFMVIRRKMTTSRVLSLFSGHAPCHDLLIGFLSRCSCSSLHQIRARPRPESIRITEDQAKKMARHSIHHKGLRRSTTCQSFCSFAAQTTAAAQSYLSDHISEHQEYMNCWFTAPPSNIRSSVCPWCSVVGKSIWGFFLPFAGRSSFAMYWQEAAEWQK